MTRLGVVGRSDQGGIAAQSFAVAKNLKPHAALVLDMEGRGRGPFDPSPWAQIFSGDRVRVARFPFTNQDLAWLLERSDAVFTVEGPPPGRDDFPQLCAQYGVPLFVHANPELWRDSYRGPTTRVLLPTTWHAERFPDAVHLPMPVDRGRFPHRHRTQARTFLHVAAPAFHDRNGTDLVRAALPHVKSPVKVYVRGVTEAREEGRVGEVELIFLPPVTDHADLYPPDVDVLILPRRYGGQCLVLNEAAAAGIPAVMLDLPPQNTRKGLLFVAPYPAAPHQHMIGGQELVYDASPAELAAAIDLLAETPRMVESLSDAADRWASDNSWDALRARWCATLGV